MSKGSHVLSPSHFLPQPLPKLTCNSDPIAVVEAALEKPGRAEILTAPQALHHHLTTTFHFTVI